MMTISSTYREALVGANIASQFEKGIYVNNWENKKLNRVGQVYGDDLVEKLKRQTSKRKFTDPETHRYHDTRFALHRQIVNDIVDKGTKQEKPTVIMLLGSPSCGKSHVYKTQIAPHINKVDNTFAYLNADEIKEKLPEYNQYILQNAESAAHRVHEESADITRIAYAKLVREKRNFVFDSTMCNSYSAVNKINDLKKAGYKVELVGVMAALDVVKKSVIARGKATGRYVPMHLIESKHAGALDTFEHLATKEATKIHNVLLYSNNDMLKGGAPKLIYHNGQNLNAE